MSSPKEIDRNLLFRPASETLLMMHKPRGSKGVWQPVESKSKLRVTKGKGKRLKLQYEVPTTEEQDVQVILLDLEKRGVCKNGFNIESAKKNNQSIEMDIKLLKVCKSALQFCLYFTNQQGQSSVAKSVEFATHNSGTVSGKASNKNDAVIFPSRGEKRSRSNSDSTPESPRSLSPVSFSPEHSSPAMVPLFVSTTNNRVLQNNNKRGNNSSIPIATLLSPEETQKLTPYVLAAHQSLSCDCGCSPAPIKAHTISFLPPAPQLVLAVPQVQVQPQTLSFGPQQQQRFYCLTCKSVPDTPLCIICTISCHSDHEIKYAGVSSAPCNCISTTHKSHNTNLPPPTVDLNSENKSESNERISLPPLAPPEQSEEGDEPSPKRQKIPEFESLGLVAQVCSQINPLPVM